MEKISVAVRIPPHSSSSSSSSDSSKSTYWKVVDNTISLCSPPGTPISGQNFAFESESEEHSMVCIAKRVVVCIAMGPAHPFTEIKMTSKSDETLILQKKESESKETLIYQDSSTIFEVDMKKDIEESIYLLQSVCGKDLVAESLVSWPSLLSISKEKGNFQSQINFLLKCGFKKNTKLIIKALNCISKKSEQDLEAILGGLINHGLSQNYAYKLIRIQPTLLHQEPIEITRKLDYIFHRLCFSVEELFKYSSFMLYGLDSHLKPRYLMHQWIKSKRIIRRNFKLDYIMSMSEKQFRSKFVGCHADGLRVYNEVMRKVCEEMLRKT